MFYLCAALEPTGATIPKCFTATVTLGLPACLNQRGPAITRVDLKFIDTRRLCLCLMLFWHCPGMNNNRRMFFFKGELCEVQDVVLVMFVTKCKYRCYHYIHNHTLPKARDLLLHCISSLKLTHRILLCSGAGNCPSVCSTAYP